MTTIHSPFFIAGVTSALLGGTAWPALAQSDIAPTDAIVLEEVVLTATGFAQQIKDAPATITVIDGKDIAERHYTSVSDAVRNVPGVVVSSTSPRSGADQISIRGLDEEYVLILVDGKPLGNSEEAAYNGFGVGLGKSQLPPAAAIERIEVIRGPMSSLYGSAASGGVINVITKPVSDAWTGSFNIGSTSFENDGMGHSTEGRFYLSGPLVNDQLGISLFGSFYDRSKPRMTYTSRRSVGVQQQDILRRSLGARMDWVIDNDQDLRFEVLASDNDTATLSESGQSGGIEAENMTYGLTHNLSWGAGFKTTSYVTFDDTEFVNGDNISGYEMLNLNTKTNMSFGRHEITVGLDYRDEKTIHDLDRFLANPQDQNARPNAEMTRWNWALFGEDNFSINENMIATFGLRYDDNEKYGDHFTPRIYGVWHATPSLTIKGGISGGYNVPTLKQADSNIFESAGGGSGTDQGNTNLKPEETINYEIGAVWESQGGVQLGLTAYHTAFKNGIDRETVCDIKVNADCGKRPDGSTNMWIKQYVNRDRAKLSGIEATADFKLGVVDVGLNYTYAKSEITSGDAKGQNFNDNPRHVVNLDLGWQATDKLYAWANAQHRSSTQDEGNNTIGTHTIVDLGVDYDLNERVKVNAAIYNAGNKTFGATNYNDGRAIYLGLTGTF